MSKDDKSRRAGGEVDGERQPGRQTAKKGGKSRGGWEEGRKAGGRPTIQGARNKKQQKQARLERGQAASKGRARDAARRPRDFGARESLTALG